MKRTLFSMMALLVGTVAGCGGGTTTTPSACATVTCTSGQFCDGATGMCKTASSCSGVTCAAGTVCDGAPGSATAGMCVATTCGATQCINGQVCNNATATCVNPGVPALSVQIDRIGRPAINTALTNPYDVYKPGGVGQPEPGDITKDHYNHDSAATGWVAAWSPTIAANLAALDGLLGGTCGDQIAFGSALGVNYTGLATLLAGDILLVDTTQGTCTGYLSVESKALGVANTDCGGRKLDYDVIDTTYTVLTNGAKVGGPTVVTDGIAQTTAPSATFPYFTAAQ